MIQLDLGYMIQAN